MSYQRFDHCPFTLLNCTRQHLLAYWPASWVKAQIALVILSNPIQRLLKYLYPRAVLLPCRILEEARRGSICPGAQRVRAPCTVGATGVTTVGRSLQRQA